MTLPLTQVHMTLPEWAQDRSLASDVHRHPYGSDRVITHLAAAWMDDDLIVSMRDLSRNMVGERQSKYIDIARVHFLFRQTEENPRRIVMSEFAEIRRNDSACTVPILIAHPPDSFFVCNRPLGATLKMIDLETNANPKTRLKERILNCLMEPRFAREAWDCAFDMAREAPSTIVTWTDIDLLAHHPIDHTEPKIFLTSFDPP